VQSGEASGSLGPGRLLTAWKEVFDPAYCARTNISARFSPTKLRIRELLTIEVGSGAADTLVSLNHWVNLVHEGKSYRITHRAREGAGLVEQIAEDLTSSASGTERKLLSKSLQEAIYYGVRFDTKIDFDEFNVRLSRYLHRWGIGTLIRRFLCLFFFNFVRFHIGESLRELSGTTAEFESYSQDLERVCQRAVGPVWLSFEKTNRSLDLRAANKIMSDIEHRLRGN